MAMAKPTSPRGRRKSMAEAAVFSESLELTPLGTRWKSSYRLLARQDANDGFVLSWDQPTGSCTEGMIRITVIYKMKES